jgi:hypothetical protein
MFSGGGFLKYYPNTTTRLGAEGRKNFRDGWRDLHGQAGRFEPPILEDDMDIHTLGMSNEDAELLSSRKFSAYEICQFLGVPPHMVFLMDRATWANTEQMGLEFLTIHLNPYLVRIEQEVQTYMGESHFAEFLRDAIVRGDIASRYAAYNTGLQAGFLTRNEVRAKENLDPIEGGDELLAPLNMAPAGQRATPEPEPDPEPKDDDEEPEAAAVAQPVVVSADWQPIVVEIMSPPVSVAVAESAPPPAPPAPGIDMHPLIADAAERIVAREAMGLNARIEKADKDPAAYFAWAVTWHEKHRDYVAKTVAPLAKAAASELDPVRFAADYCDSSVQELARRDIAVLTNEWAEAKTAELTTRLETLLCTIAS